MKSIKVNPTYVEVSVSTHLRKWEDSRSREYFEYRKKWYGNPENQIIGDFPLHLDIEVSRSCNLSCTMCMRTIKLRRKEISGEGNIDFNLFKKVIDDGAKKGLCSIKLNYLGEPLVYKNIANLVAYAKKKGIIDVMFNTNGVLLTCDLSKSLIRAGLDKIFISFDSPFKEKYEKIRAGANFEKVVENVRNLVRLRGELNKVNPIVGVNMTVMKENKDEVLDFIKLWAPIVDLIGFGDYLNPQGLDNENRYAISLKKRENFVCPQLYQRLFVHWDGRIGLCCVDYEAELDLCNAKDVLISEVWKGNQMNEIRTLHNSGKYEKIPLCNRCHHPCVPN